MNVYRLLTCLTVSALVPTTASAQGKIPSVNTPPTGPGTEARAATPRGEHIVEGFQGGAQLGSGFTDTYGFGMGARVGYTFLRGLYVGGAVSHYFGKSVDTLAGSESAHATFFGGEIGYEFYAARRWEVRPYAFVGPAWITTVEANPFVRESKTRLALQPGLLVGYHFGNVFLSAEGKVHATPEPSALTVMAGAGLGFQ